MQCIHMWHLDYMLLASVKHSVLLSVTDSVLAEGCPCASGYTLTKFSRLVAAVLIS